MTADPRPHRPAKRHGFPFFKLALLVLVLAAVAGWGIVSRLRAEATLVVAAEAALVPNVQTIEAAAVPSDEDVTLPGTVQPQIEAPIYARTSGYVKAWFTDIGTPVKKGQVLAELETPEIDQQLRQADADYGTALANEQLAQSSAKRWKALLATDSVSQQENDEKQADAAAKHAALASAQANLTRLQELEAFKHVIAPFDGVVTARNTDTGALINSGAGNGAALFHVADTSHLRIFVQAPESVAPLLHPGVHAQLTMAVDPSHEFDAEVVRTADSLDSATRSLLVEIAADNEDHRILAGGYCRVHFKLPIAAGKPRLPVSALIFRAGGTQVARVDSSLHAHLVDIKLGRDFGNQIEIAKGITAGDVIINSPPDSLSDGDAVKIAGAPPRNPDGASRTAAP